MQRCMDQCMRACTHARLHAALHRPVHACMHACQVACSAASTSAYMHVRMSGPTAPCMDRGRHAAMPLLSRSVGHAGNVWNMLVERVWSHVPRASPHGRTRGLHMLRYNMAGHWVGEASEMNLLS
eukprot:366435-Chlamydomonas_euryale.AAC.3